MNNRHITVDEFGKGLRKVKEELDKIGGIDVDSAIAAHNADGAAHPSIQSKINEVKDRVLALEIANGGDVTANPFAVTFGSLDGTVSDGIWNPADMRLEF